MLRVDDLLGSLVIVRREADRRFAVSQSCKDDFSGAAVEVAVAVALLHHLGNGGHFDHGHVEETAVFDLIASVHLRFPSSRHFDRGPIPVLPASVLHRFYWNFFIGLRVGRKADR